MTQALINPIFDRQLLSRYQGYGPRYTSYPTAISFHEGHTAAEHRRALQLSNQLPIPAPLSIYVHVPFCDSPCFYCACNRVISRQHVKAQEFLQRLLEEIDLHAELLDSDREVTHIHFGGGTPTWLNDVELASIMRHLQRRFTLRDDAQIGIEIDPRTVDTERLQNLHNLGFNRLSLGVQDLNPQVQLAVNREQSIDAIAGVLNGARSVGFNSLAIDLIYGLPKQTVAGFTATVKQIIEWQPDRLSVFHYAHLPSMFPGQRQIAEHELPDEEQRLGMFQAATELLLEAGYRYIGLDHFALPDNELVLAAERDTLCRNFQGYATEGDCDLIGLGPSAISQIGDCFSQNAKALSDYYRRIDQRRLATVRGYQRHSDDRIRAQLIESIMCRGTVDFSALEVAYGINAKSYFDNCWQRLENMAKDGLIDFQYPVLRVTARGRLFLRCIAAVFDAYLNQPETDAERPRFSKVI
jgi:oxygen-independent coproporphyrinogen-3 oxidase